MVFPNIPFSIAAQQRDLVEKGQLVSVLISHLVATVVRIALLLAAGY